MLGRMSADPLSADPATWQWPKDVARLPDNAPLQALLLTATKLSGGYGQCGRAGGGSPRGAAAQAHDSASSAVGASASGRGAAEADEMLAEGFGHD